MKKPLRDYQSYTLEDFINEEKFLLWVLQPNEELNGWCNQIQTAHPHLDPIIKQAKAIVLSMRFTTDTLSPMEQKELWSVIVTKTTLAQATVKTRLGWYRYAVAAVVVGILFCVGLLYSANQKVTINTPYGHLKTITLPDGSLVTLNANSKIKYDKSWDKDEIREVWIEGEAFLNVNHLHKTGSIQNRDRFIVHTGGVNVEVLGTTFNVNDRRGRTEVALLNGKISLALNTGKGEQLILAPGDIAEYVDGKLIKKPINVSEYSSWKDGKLYFNNVPVSKLFEYFEDIYGYKVVVDNPDILVKRISGTMSSKERDVLFRTIAVTLNIRITPKDDSRELIITSK